TLLQSEGVLVSAFASGRDALEAVDQIQPRLIVSDIGLPDYDGYQFMSDLRSRPDGRGGNTPAIALSAAPADRDRSRALLAGYQWHITKPVHHEELVDAIRCLLRVRPIETSETKRAE
ncbi:MAG TPA: response regulator, partial [Polyangiaceae bacterium]|nr:response regulator [Polyangiaceae bacterium]